MIEIIISFVCLVVCFIFGINYGKKQKEFEYKNNLIKNIIESKNIDDTCDDDIIKLHDKYE